MNMTSNHTIEFNIDDVKEAMCQLINSRVGTVKIEPDMISIKHINGSSEQQILSKDFFRVSWMKSVDIK